MRSWLATRRRLTWASRLRAVAHVLALGAICAGAVLARADESEPAVATAEAARGLSRDWLGRALALAERRSWEEALRCAREALAAQPSLDPDTTTLDVAWTLAYRALRETGSIDTTAIASLDTLAWNLYFERNRLASARRMLELGLGMRRARPGELGVPAYREMHVIGHIRFDEADYAGAQTLYEQVRVGYARAYGDSSIQVVSMQFNLSNTYYVLGQQHEALRMLEDARCRFVTFGAWDRVADCDLNMSAVQGELGDHWAAMRDAERCLGIRRGLGMTGEQLSDPLIDLASACADVGRDARALALLDTAQAVLESSVRPDHPSQFAVRSKRAEVLGRIGRVDEAVALLRGTLEQQGEVMGALHPDRLVTFHVLAALEAARGSFGEALALLDSATVNMPDNPAGGSLRDVSLRARIHLALGDSLRAYDEALRAEKGTREFLELTASGASRTVLTWRERPRVEALGLACASLPAGVSGSDAERLLDAVVRSRAIVVDREARRLHAFTEDSATAALRATFERAASRLAGLALQRPVAVAAVLHARLLAEARQSRDRAERALADRSREFRGALEEEATGLAEIIRRLDRDEALVSFVQFDAPCDARAFSVGAPCSRSFYAACITRSGHATRFVRLGAAVVIDSLVSRWRTAAQDEAMEGAGTYRIVASELRRRIWDPLVPYLGGVGTLDVVPDGMLGLVSLGTLTAADGRYLIESGPRIVVLSAERDRLTPAGDAPTAHRLLAVGGVDFDHAASGARVDTRSPTPVASGVFRGSVSHCLGLAEHPFVPLPGSGWEVRELASRWDRSRGRGAARVLVGDEPTEASFKRLAPRFDLLHLATHGLIVAPRCAGPSVSPDSATGPPAPYDESPLLRTGLALAGCNEPHGRSPDAEDGVLTGEEIAALDLSRVRCAVLSACESGAGDVVPGEGVYGLRRAFRIAGANALVTSLWPVDDLATRAWMSRFYERLLAGATPARAADEVSRALLARARAAGVSTRPATWGAFVATGGR